MATSLFDKLEPYKGILEMVRLVKIADVNKKLYLVKFSFDNRRVTILYCISKLLCPLAMVSQVKLEVGSPQVGLGYCHITTKTNGSSCLSFILRESFRENPLHVKWGNLLTP